MRDLESTELYKIHTIREKFEETASIFGFKMVDPSPISLSTLEAKSGPEIRKEIYNFKDKADREIALRFDFTVAPVMSHQNSLNACPQNLARLVEYGDMMNHNKGATDIFTSGT